MKETIKTLKKLGYNDIQISKIINSHSISIMTDNTLSLKIPVTFLYFQNKGFSDEKIIKMTTDYPEIYAVSFSNIENKFKLFQELGYNDNQMVKLFSADASNITVSRQHIITKFNNLTKIGYSEKEVIKMSLKLPTIFGLDIENNIKAKQRELIDLGFTEEQMIKMTINHPDIFSYSKSRLSKQMEDFGNLGFERETVIAFFADIPPLFGLTFKNIENKINYLKEIDALEAIMEKKGNLIQGVDLTYARNEYFKAKRIEFESDHQRYLNLFLSAKTFEEKYNITKEELLKEYCEAKKNGKNT